MAPRKIVVGQLELYPDSPVRRAYWKGSRVPLSPFEFRLLVVMKPGSNKALSSSFLQKEMAAHGYASHIRSLVRHLRKKFRTVDPTFRQLVTKYMFGYGWQTE